MQHYRSLEEVNLPAAWMTIGSFDGVHRGHQAIIGKLVERAHAANFPVVVLTFFPHPNVVLRSRQEPFYLNTPEERAALLGSLGVDVVITHPFTRGLAAMSAHDFIDLIDRYIHPRHIMVGYDFALGRGREGNVNRLGQLGEEFGYTLDVIQPIQMEGEIVSSSQIRNALMEGDLAKAGKLLGRPYQVSGEVIHGDGRGRLLGIPTANLDVWRWRVLPKAGVYVCQAHVDGQIWGAVTNVGVRPTFENQPAQPHVETHVLDLDRDLYGRQVQLDFIDRLRDEKRFPTVELLVQQIQRDIQSTRNKLNQSQ
jgi:riboflavin kinase / FMN adenylyltransferase